MSVNDPNNIAGAKSEIAKPQSRDPILLHFLNAVLESDGQPFAKSVEARNPFNKFSCELSPVPCKY